MTDERIVPSTTNLIEVARRLIDDAFIGTWEVRLNLASPDHLFRRNLMMAVEGYLLVPQGGLASLSRKSLDEDKAYLSKLQVHLSELLKLLPRENFEECAHAMLVRVEVIGNAPLAEQPARARKLFELRAGLEDLLAKVSMQVMNLANVRISPNDKLGAQRLLVSQLAGIFLESTGEDPRKHVRGTTAKDSYSGLFFEFADAVLRKLGDKQSMGARGKLIKMQLRTFRAAKK
jgi:hypothetical protein